MVATVYRHSPSLSEAPLRFQRAVIRLFEGTHAISQFFSLLSPELVAKTLATK